MALQCESKSDLWKENNRIWLGQEKNGLDHSNKIWEHVYMKIWYTQDTIL